MLEKDSVINFELLENGLDFIYSAIEYLSQSYEKKDLKYGILHLSAGVELIFKYKLSQEHWSLLFQNIDDANKNKLKLGDFNSVDSKKCIDRLKEICGINFEEKTITQLKNLRERRNKLEHFGLLEPSMAVKASSLKVLNIIFEFIKEHIDDSELNQEEENLMEKINTALIKFEDFIKERWKKIRPEVESYKNSTAVTFCPSCYQPALVVDDGARCIFCGFQGEGEEAADNYVENVLGISIYETVKDGGESPVTECPECGRYSFVYTSDKSNAWICFSCGYIADVDDISYCDTCGAIYVVDREDIGMCENCIDHRMNND